MFQLSSFKRSIQDATKKNTRKKIERIKKLTTLMKFSHYVKILVNLEQNIKTIANLANELITHMKKDQDVSNLKDISFKKFMKQFEAIRDLMNTHKKKRTKKNVFKILTKNRLSSKQMRII